MEVAVTSVLEEHLPRIRRAFEEHGFVQAGDLADRHGALQLTFVKEASGIARLVLLNEAIGTGENDYRGSVDVVVQVDDRFVRRRVVASQSRGGFEREITRAAVEAAVTLADTLNEEDLAESFALRGPGPDESSRRDAAEAIESAKELLAAALREKIDDEELRTREEIEDEELRTYVELVDGSHSVHEIALKMQISKRRVFELSRKFAARRRARHSA